MKDWMKRCVVFWQLLCLTGLLLFAGCGQAMLSDENLARRSKKEFSKMKQKQALSQNRSYQSMIKEIGERKRGLLRWTFLERSGNLWSFKRMSPMRLRCPVGKWA